MYWSWLVLEMTRGAEEGSYETDSGKLCDGGRERIHTNRLASALTNSLS